MALAVLIHMVVSTFAAIVLGMTFGRMNPVIALAGLSLGFVAGFLAWRRFRKEDRLFPGINLTTGLFYGFVIFAGFQHFLYLLYYDQNGLKTLHLNNFGDLSMHIQYIRYLAGAGFWPGDPGFAGTLLRYPLGMDLYNALWEALGVPIDSHLFVVGVVMTVLTVSMLNKWMGWWGVGAFFLNGGLANWRFVLSGRMYDFQNDVAWKNFFLSLWITQRGFLFAVPAGVYVIKMVLETLLGERTLSRDEKIVCAVLWSGLAWFHLHSFFILTLTLGICIVLYRKVRPMLGILIPAASVGSIFVLFSTNAFSMSRVLHIQWGWVAGGENFIRFWFVNLGTWIIIWAIGIFLLFKKQYSLFRPAAAVFFILFLVFTFVMVAPWDWDNIKILLWLYLLIAWLVGRIWVRDIPAWASVLVGCIVFFSGAISVVSSMPGNNPGVRLYQASEIWESKAALMDLPGDAVLAVVPDPNHPAMFWGTKVALDYPGHIWSHGVDSSERERQLDEVFKGGKDWLSYARNIGITHIYWGENEKRKYGIFDQPWRHQLKNVSRSEKIQVYDLSANLDKNG